MMCQNSNSWTPFGTPFFGQLIWVQAGRSIVHFSTIHPQQHTLSPAFFPTQFHSFSLFLAPIEKKLQQPFGLSLVNQHHHVSVTKGGQVGTSSLLGEKVRVCTCYLKKDTQSSSNGHISITRYPFQPYKESKFFSCRLLSNDTSFVEKFG